MKNAINDRIRAIIKNEKITKKFFCEIIGISDNTLKTVFARNSNPSLDLLQKISDKYPKYSLRWLVNGDGQMEIVRYETNENEDTTILAQELAVEYKTSFNFKLIPLHSMDIVPDSYQGVGVNGCVMGYVPFIGAMEDDISLMVTGNSMSPTYPNGCYIHLRLIDDWKTFFKLGQVYLLDLVDNKRLLKEVHKGNDDKHVKLISYNEKFEEITIDKSFIRCMWTVLAKYEKLGM